MLNKQQVFDFDCLSQEQILLLKACVLDKENAIDAWREWQKYVDIEKLDAASNSLLSQLYYNLSACKVKNLELERLKGIYKRNWYANQILFQKLKVILKNLGNSNIPTILLGDSAIAAGYYQSYSQRVIHQFSLLLHPDDGKLAVSLLQKHGWSVNDRTQFILEKNNLLVLLENESRNKLQLISNIFWTASQEYTNKQIWINTTTCKINSINTLILDSTEIFLYLCLALFDWNKNKSIVFLIDAMIVLNQTEKFDWQKLIIQAQKYQLGLTLKSMLVLLQKIFQLSIPDWVLSKLDRAINRQEAIRAKISKAKDAYLLEEI